MPKFEYSITALPIPDTQMSIFLKRQRLCRDDYKPHRVEMNLRTGKWALASNVKRHGMCLHTNKFESSLGFVEILEDGEKIGLVMCVACAVVCSKNSFRKIR